MSKPWWRCHGTLLVVLSACVVSSCGGRVAQEPCRLIDGGTPADDAPPGCLLQAGMRLVYEAEGGSSEWRVEGVRTGVDHAGRSGCSEIVFAGRGEAGGPEIRWRCREGDFLYGYEGSSETWTVLRPVVGERSWERRRADGILLARYTTGELAFEEIGAHRVGVVETAVESFDSLGAVTRRLRERYAPGLETATGGVFEVPDPQASGGWRPVSTFRLVSIIPPG